MIFRFETMRLRDVECRYLDHNIITEHNGEPRGNFQSYRNEDKLPLADNKNLDSEILPPHKRGEKLIENNSSDKISVFLTSMPMTLDDSLSFPKYLNVAHKVYQIKKD